MEGLNYKNIVITIITIAVAGGLFLYIANKSQETIDQQEGQAMMDNPMIGDNTMIDSDNMSGGTMLKGDDSAGHDNNMVGGDAMIGDGNMLDEGQLIDEGGMMADVTYSGTILSSGVSQVIDFNQSDYDTAVKAGKTILLYFYANWCPLCAEEVPHFYQAFSELNRSGVVGFRVNYNDNNTDSMEKDLAREFGVAYQHTKIIVRDGQRLLKSPATWDKNQYISAINNLFK